MTGARLWGRQADPGGFSGLLTSKASPARSRHGSSRVLVCAMGCAGMCGLILALASCAAPSFEIADLGSFYVAGAEASLADNSLQIASSVSGPGEVETGQTYVQFVRLRRPASPFPVLMIPGGSLSGASYETTPDGRPGWQSNFLHGGYSVAIADFGQVGRSPWSSFPALADPPVLRAKSFFWEVARIGPPGSYTRDPANRRPYTNTRFPVAAYDALSRQIFARFRAPQEIQRRRYRALIERACPCIVVAHSAAGPVALTTAIERPDLVAALILVEPSSGIGPRAEELARARHLPILFVWGDYLNATDDWRSIFASARTEFESIRRANLPAVWMELPARGLAGNSHMLMMDTNSDQIAQLMMDWLARNAPHSLQPQGGRSNSLAAQN